MLATVASVRVVSRPYDLHQSLSDVFFQHPRLVFSYAGQCASTPWSHHLHNDNPAQLRTDRHLRRTCTLAGCFRSSHRIQQHLFPNRLEAMSAFHRPLATDI